MLLRAVEVSIMNLEAHGTPIALPFFDPDAMFRRLLVPVDFNDATKCAVAEALDLRRRFGSEVHLFRFAEQDETGRFLAGTGADGTDAQTVLDEARDRLRRFVANVFPGHEHDVIVHADVGIDVADAVVKEAARVRATLVVVGLEPRRHLFRSPMEKVAQRLICPVLLVRPPALG